MRRLILAVTAALLVAGCGHTQTTVPKTPFLAPESARTPDNAAPAAPPKGLFLALPGARHISVRGLRLIEGFEGWSACPYWDAYGHVWTRGYGETESITAHSPCITRTQGEAKLRSLVEARYEWALRSLGVPLNQNEWDALDSFVWNVGAGIFQGTTVGADLRARHFRAAARVMLQYDHAGGVVLAGLRTRRETEVRLFLTPVAEPADHRVQLEHAYRYRAHLRQVLVVQHCRVAHPNLHCRGVLHSGATVNRQIRAWGGR